MGYYDIRDNNDNLIASNVWIDESGGKGSADSLTISATLLYFFGFIGMGIMMFNIPMHFIFMGIIALLIYSLPLIMVLLAIVLRPIAKKHEEKHEFEYFEEEDEPFTYHLSKMLTGGGGIVKSIFKNFFAPFAYCLFNVFIALFWICYPIGSIKEATLIGLVVPCAYAMYYYPFVLIKNALKRKSKALGFATAAIIIGSLAVFLVNYNSFMQTDSVVGLAFFFSMITVLGTFAILIGNLILSKRKTKRAILLVIYTVLVAVVAILFLAILPKQNEDRYSEAVQCVESGEYRKARELFSELGRYKDSEEKYNEIKFVNLEVGEKIILGTQTDKPDSSQGENPLSWTVIAVDGDKALVLSDAILTSIDSNSLSQWTKSNSVRNSLNNMEGLFSEDEKARIQQYTYNISVNGSSVSTTDKLFLLSRAELEQYCTKEQIFAEKDTKYNDHQVLGYQMADFDYEYKYSFYVRDVNDNGEWIIADCEAKQFIVKDNKYVGIRPAMYISMDEESSE